MKHQVMRKCSGLACGCYIDFERQGCLPGIEPDTSNNNGFVSELKTDVQANLLLNLADDGVIYTRSFAKSTPVGCMYKPARSFHMNRTHTASNIDLAIMRSSQLLAKAVNKKPGWGAIPDAG